MWRLQNARSVCQAPHLESAARYDAPVPQQPPSGVTPVLRQASRIVLLDECDRTLLFRWEDARLDEGSIWITRGGGLHDGESPKGAARREPWEETGIEAEPGPCVWSRRHVFRFGEHWIDQREQYYLVRVARVDVRDDNLEPEERVAMIEHRLWSAAEIASSSEWFAPRGLAVLLPPLIRGDAPAEPIELGA